MDLDPASWGGLELGLKIWIREDLYCKDSGRQTGVRPPTSKVGNITLSDGPKHLSELTQARREANGRRSAGPETPSRGGEFGRHHPPHPATLRKKSSSFLPSSLGTHSGDGVYKQMGTGHTACSGARQESRPREGLYSQTESLLRGKHGQWCIGQNRCFPHH